jgi:hypothetical protein
MLNDLDEDRRRMIAETSAFITWGLGHPQEVPNIPRKRLDEGGFSRAMTRSFWYAVLGTQEIAPLTVVRRFMRWATS